MARDPAARPHELLSLKIKDVTFKIRFLLIRNSGMQRYWLTLIFAIFIALEVVFVARLVVVPAIEQAALANKGGVPNGGHDPVRVRKRL